MERVERVYQDISMVDSRHVTALPGILKDIHGTNVTAAQILEKPALLEARKRKKDMLNQIMYPLFDSSENLIYEDAKAHLNCFLVD